MRFFIQKLGCPKNDVDADYIAARLVYDGHTPVSSHESAETVIVNTCGFIQSAKEESIHEILSYGATKREGKLGSLYATGCLTQRYGYELLAEIPELDGAFGHGALDSLAAAVATGGRQERAVRMETRKLGYLTWRNRFISDDFPYAYLKISDGCDRGCTYCAIPNMRGMYRSRPLDSILREAEYLAQQGKKELILVSQEATLWGSDLPGGRNLIDMLRALESLEGVEWIRLLYLYPAELDHKVIRYLANSPKTLPYFDLPFQHVNDQVLTAMNRRVTRSRIEELITAIRTECPDPTIRTTFIVGFPGETEDQFAELSEFVATQKFDRMGVFTYSAEDGTPAEMYADQVEEKTKQERMEELMSIQREIALDRNERMVGRCEKVLIDELDQTERVARARSMADAPDIDQEILLPFHGRSIGEFLTVRITGSVGYDLLGEAI